MDENEEFEFRHRAEQESATAIAEPPSTAAVAAQSAVKGVASIPDAIFNAPANVMNLGKAAVGRAAGAVGRDDIAADMELTQPPSPVAGTLEQIGAISPEREPATAGQRVLDRSIQAGVNLAVAPAKGLGELIKNMALGALSGFTGGVTKEVTGSDMAALAVSVATPLAARTMTGSSANKATLANPVKTQTIRDAQAAGYVIPPSAVKPSFTTNKLESVGGKAAVKQEAAVRNQEVTNKLAAKAIGLPETEPITPSAVLSVRTEANKVYERVADLSPRAKSALDRLKEERLNASDGWMEYARTRRADARRAAVSSDAKVGQLERVIAKEATKAGEPGLTAELSRARTLIAKTYNVEDAMNIGSGNVDAGYIGRMLDRGAPLTGELKVIGKFAQAFPAITREGVTSAGVSGTEAGMAAMLGTGGYAAAGGPVGLAAAGLPLLRSPARSALLSGAYQRRLLAEQPVSLNQATYQSILAGKSAAEVQGAP